MKPDKTSTLLIEHLKEKPQSETRDRIIRAAELMHYDDFGSTLATPKTELYTQLHLAEYPDLAKNVTEGIYD